MAGHHSPGELVALKTGVVSEEGLRFQAVGLVMDFTWNLLPLHLKVFAEHTQDAGNIAIYDRTPFDRRHHQTRTRSRPPPRQVDFDHSILTELDLRKAVRKRPHQKPVAVRTARVQVSPTAADQRDSQSSREETFPTVP